MFANFHLIGRFVQLFEMTTRFAVIIGIISEPPVGIEIKIVANTTIYTQLKAVKADGIPECSETGLERKTGSAQGQGKVVKCGQLLIVGWQIAVEPDDITVITCACAGKEQEGIGFDQCCIESAEYLARTEVPAGIDGRQFDTV